MDVLNHHSDTTGVSCGHRCLFEEPNKKSLGGFLETIQSDGLPFKFKGQMELHPRCNFTDDTCEASPSAKVEQHNDTLNDNWQTSSNNLDAPDKQVGCLLK